MMNYSERLPEKCIEIIMEYLNYSDLKNCSKSCERFKIISENLLRLRKCKFQNILKQNNKGKWVQLAENKQGGPRFDTTLVYHNNCLYLYGGANCALTTFNDFWKYDIDEDSWSRIISRNCTPNPRAASFGFIYKDELFLIGGYQIEFSFINRRPRVEWDMPVYKYSFTSNLWNKLVITKSSKLQEIMQPSGTDLLFIDTQNLTDYPIGQSYCLLKNKVVLFGGLHNSLEALTPRTPTNNLYMLDLDTDKLSLVEKTTGKAPYKRFGHTASALDSSRMIICGGYIRFSETLNSDLSDIYVFDISTYSWTFIRSEPDSVLCNPITLHDCVFNNTTGLLGFLITLSSVTSKHDRDFEPDAAKRKLQLFYNNVIDCLNNSSDGGDNTKVAEYMSSWLIHSRDYPVKPSVRTGFSLCTDGIGAIYLYGGVYTEHIKPSLNIVLSQDRGRTTEKSCYQDLYKFTYKGSAAC